MSDEAIMPRAASARVSSTWRRRPALEWLLLAVLAWALLGLGWTPYDPSLQAFREDVLQGPSVRHWLGIDALGRDVLSRVWLGAGHTVLLGAAAAGGALGPAVLLLIIERRGPRFARHAVRALVAAGLAMPVFLVGLVLLVFLRPSPSTLVIACALGGVPLAFRQLRAVWLEQVGALYVLASRALGATRGHLVWFTIWPNIRPQIAALARVLFAIGVLEFSGLSFLGLNGDPDFAELGAILRQSQKEIFRQPLLVLWPGLLLSGVLLLVHLSGGANDSSAVRDRLPRDEPRT